MKKIVVVVLISFCFSFSLFAQSHASCKASITKGLNYVYLQKDSNNFSYNLKELLHYFLRNNTAYSQIDKNKLFPCQPFFDDDIRIYPYYQRLHNKNIHVAIDSIKQFINHSEDIDKVLFWSLFSDKLEANKEVNHIVHAYAHEQSNIRQIAHISIALKWSADLGTLYKIDSASYIQNKLSKLLPAAIEQADPTSDSGLEGIYALINLNRIDLIKKVWIKEIIAQQKQDGGWSYDNSKAISNAHTTLLSILVLNAWINQKNNYNPNWFINQVE